VRRDDGGNEANKVKHFECAGVEENAFAPGDAAAAGAPPSQAEGARQ
jgi:hypothetical protein